MRRFFLVIAIFFSAFSIFSFAADDIKVFTLENGLQIYFLEDSSSPTVRMELCVAAGFTRQNRDTGGFFSLYEKLCGGEI